MKLPFAIAATTLTLFTASSGHAQYYSDFAARMAAQQAAQQQQQAYATQQSIADSLRQMQLQNSLNQHSGGGNMPANQAGIMGMMMQNNQILQQGFEQQQRQRDLDNALRAQTQQLSQQQSEWCKAHPDRTLFCPKR